MRRARLDLHDRYRYEFRLMAEHQAVVEEKLSEGKVARKPVVRAVKAAAAAAARSGNIPEHSVLARLGTEEPPKLSDSRPEAA